MELSKLKLKNAVVYDCRAVPPIFDEQLAQSYNDYNKIYL